MTAGSELEEVKRVDRAGLDAGDVAEGADQVLAVGLGVVDYQGAAALAVSAATELAFASAEFAGFLDFDDVGAGADEFEEGCGGGGLDQSGTFEGCARYDEGDLGDGGDAVPAGEEEGWNGAGGDGRCGCEASEEMQLECGWIAGAVILLTFVLD